MRLCFNLAKSMQEEAAEELIDIMPSEDFIRRRFGVSSSGTVVQYNLLGEPINLAGDIYYDLPFTGTIKKIETINDEDSKIGGKPSQKEKMDIYINPTLDIVEGDVIIRLPVANQKWYRVKGIATTKGGTFTYLLCISETRSTR